MGGSNGLDHLSRVGESYHVSLYDSRGQLIAETDSDHGLGFAHECLCLNDIPLVAF